MERVKFTNYLSTDIYVNEFGKFSFILMNKEKTEPLTYEVSTLQEARKIIKDNKPIIIEIEGIKHELIAGEGKYCNECSLEPFCAERFESICEIMINDENVEGYFKRI